VPESVAGDVRFRDRAAYLPGADALVLADVHLGRAATSNVEFPLNERSDALDRLRDLLAATTPETVVVAGDLLHSFSTVPGGVADAVASVADAVRDAGGSLVVTPGNHDTRLEAVFDGETTDEYRLQDGTLVCHGHEPPDGDAPRYVVGHDHPAIRIEGRRHPCFCYGEGVFQGGDVLALPAFSRLAKGVLVNGATGRDVQSPLLSSLPAFHPVVRDTDAAETLRFPPLRSFRDLL
jgi:metallophosphoesterase superfamily enzyme